MILLLDLRMLSRMGLLILSNLIVTYLVVSLLITHLWLSRSAIALLNMTMRGIELMGRNLFNTVTTLLTNKLALGEVTS